MVQSTTPPHCPGTLGGWVCSFHGAILPPTTMIQKYRATVYFIKSMHMVINNIYNTSTYIIRVVYLYDMHAW